jgi:hypothetical protein
LPITIESAPARSIAVPSLVHRLCEIFSHDFGAPVEPPIDAGRPLTGGRIIKRKMPS